MAEKLKIQFSTSTAFASTVIRRLCHSAFSHCDIIIPGEGLLGVSGPDKPSHDPGGVRIRPFNPWPYLYPPRIALLTVDEATADRIVSYARSQIGKPFDNSALWTFLSLAPTSRDWRDPDKWFCSEFLTWALESGGLFSLKNLILNRCRTEGTFSSEMIARALLQGGFPLISAKNRITPADLLLLLNPFMTKENIEEFRS